MEILNKNNIPSEFAWFAEKLDNSFKIRLGEKSKVIFGFNGIGKSTLCKILKNKNFPNLEFLSYDQAENSIINEKLIKLSFHIQAISKLDEEIAEINSKLQIKECLKRNGLTNKTIRGCIHEELEKYVSNNRFPNFKSKKEEVLSFYDNNKNVDLRNIFTYYNDFNKISKAEDELIKNNKQNLYKALDLIKTSVDKNQKECPLCGITTDWQAALENKIKKLSNIKSELIEKYKSKNLLITVDELNRQLEAFRELKSNNNLVFDVSLSSSKEEYERIENLMLELDNKTKEKMSKISEAEKKYNLVRHREEFLKKDMKRYFNIESDNIEFDDANYVITIKFPREIKTYSTGEINLITFLYSIYSFLGSDKDTLILDDPVSSLDLIHQYKIAFEIVNNIVKDKFILVLTHSVDFLNIINSQYPKKIEYMYLEQSQDIIYIDKIDYSSSNESPNIISLDKIKGYDDEGLIDYLKKRDDEASIDYEVLHYSKSEHFIDNDKNKLSNYKLIECIDNFSGFTHEDFYVNSYNKIKYLTAIRVWIERELLKLIDNDKKDEFFKKSTLAKRISFFFDNQNSSKTRHKNITKEQLMCKKVMLNQNVHYNSQISPFDYAINLSLDDLQKEIKEIKEIFK